MLSAVWVLITIVIAALLWISSSLIYTAGFFLMLGISGALLINSKWLYGIISLCCAGVLLVGAFYFEPGWFNALVKVLSFSML
jgi:hypothetical protein